VFAEKLLGALLERPSLAVGSSPVVGKKEFAYRMVCLGMVGAAICILVASYGWAD
jgi:hypothetical protein